VDADQLWAFAGFRPLASLYLGIGAGAQYRLVRIRQDPARLPATVTPAKTTDLLAESEVTALGGLLADWVIALPFSLQVRIVREDYGKRVLLDSTLIQLAYLVPL
jgi:hypothetical protein